MDLVTCILGNILNDNDVYLMMSIRQLRIDKRVGNVIKADN